MCNLQEKPTYRESNWDSNSDFVKIPLAMQVNMHSKEETVVTGFWLATSYLTNVQVKSNSMYFAGECSSWGVCGCVFVPMIKGQGRVYPFHVRVLPWYLWAVQPWDSWGKLTHKYSLCRACVGISQRGTLVGVHPTLPLSPEMRFIATRGTFSALGFCAMSSSPVTADDEQTGISPETIARLRNNRWNPILRSHIELQKFSPCH